MNASISGLMILALLLPAVTPARATTGTLSVLSPGFKSAAPPEMMHPYLMARCSEAFGKANVAYDQLKTPEQITAWQENMRRTMIEALGGFPERNPLNARVTGQLDPGDPGDFRVEKVTFESRPHYTVTALLFLPKSKPPYPGVIVPCGHSDTGKAFEGYQQAAILLARNGMAALLYEPPDQGERMQIIDTFGQGKYKNTVGHIHIGNGAIPLGRNMATWEIWDGMRAIDYLQSRPDIDPKRIGCTGNSGGGTQTAYLMALDTRIKAAAPSCYLTSFPRLLATIGPQDAEQNIFGQLASGPGHADYIMMTAPRPAIVLCATRDFFDIDGTWASYRKAKRIYARLGCAERLDIHESDQTHGFTPELRAASARFLKHWLLGSDDFIPEPDKQPTLAVVHTYCTPEGQVLLCPGERSIYALQAEEAEKLAAARAERWKSDPTAALREVRRVTGIRPLEELHTPACDEKETLPREAYTIRKLIIHPEAGIELPALAFIPGKDSAEPILYLHGEGKQADAAPGGPIEKLVREGHVVLAVDLRGLGETKAPALKKDPYGKYLGPEWIDTDLAYMLGTSFLAMRAEDAMVCARFLATWPATGMVRKVRLVSIGATGPAALHAAALEPQLFSGLEIKDSLESWESVVRDPEATRHYVNLVHGALRVYDLPDLRAALPPALR